MATLGSPGMGIGRLGSPDLVVKRPNLFELTIQTASGLIPTAFVRKAARPNIEIEEIEVPFLNEITWLPGRARWQTMEIEFMDVATNDMFPLYNWIASVYDFTNVNRTMGSRRSDYEGTGTLNVYDGCGSLLEVWIYNNMFPTNVNFNEVNQETGNEYLRINMTVRYSNVQYRSVCPAFQPKGVCTPCR